MLARDSGRRAGVAAVLPVATHPGEMVDAQVMAHALAAVQPEVLILNGGATPHMAPLPQPSWEIFTRHWDLDVKATFLWIQAVLAWRMAPGGRVVVTSSGAALNGSPLSGSYAGARRRVWLLCAYPNALGVVSVSQFEKRRQLRTAE